MSNKIIGIVGGIGPYAGIDLLKKIHDNTIANSDSEHLSTLLFSVPQMIPDRNNYIINNTGENPAVGINKAIKRLSLCGASIISISCNAAHSQAIFNQVEKYCKKKELQLMNIVNSTINYLTRHNNTSLCAVFSIKGTYHSKVYEKALIDQKIKVYNISPSIIDEIHEVIWNDKWGIKSKSSPIEKEVRSRLINIIDFLKGEGVDTIILACTELPLAIKESNINGVRIIDPTVILARDIIKTIAPKKLKNNF